MYGSFGSGCRVKLARRKKYGEGLCYVVPDVPGARKWYVVMWDGAKEPVLVPADQLLVKPTGWPRFRRDRLS